MNNLLITKENKKTKRFILVFLLFTIYFFNGSLILAQNERNRQGSIFSMIKRKLANLHALI